MGTVPASEQLRTDSYDRWLPTEEGYWLGLDPYREGIPTFFPARVLTEPDGSQSLMCPLTNIKKLRFLNLLPRDPKSPLTAILHTRDQCWREIRDSFDWTNGSFGEGLEHALAAKRIPADKLLEPGLGDLEFWLIRAALNVHLRDGDVTPHDVWYGHYDAWSERWGYLDEGLWYPGQRDSFESTLLCERLVTKANSCQVRWLRPAMVPTIQRYRKLLAAYQGVPYTETIVHGKDQWTPFDEYHWYSQHSDRLTIVALAPVPVDLSIFEEPRYTTMRAEKVRQSTNMSSSAGIVGLAQRSRRGPGRPRGVPGGAEQAKQIRLLRAQGKVWSEIERLTGIPERTARDRLRQYPELCGGN